ncbi:diguanylate cyclase [Bacillus sp. M6-12]|uniref:bifunctional diguanylate cyclase/phosphodiesterase n=1 Tax=Bacillus sp. M6-12 TaxID=2054166 RepID=UPI000C7881BB|nr:EAL domain-containing protein [Bacillus sp. M6-12]PLS15504.1 diguanylate cyclase [Bacillus sp. M6-12]
MSRTFSCTYENGEQLETYILENELMDYPDILIQLFSGRQEVNAAAEVKKELLDLLPNAVLIGCTTDGEIINGTSSTGTIAIHFTVFEKTRVKSILLETSDFPSGRSLGKKLVKELCKADTKVILLFSTAFGLDALALLAAIHEENKDVTVIGALAGDGGLFKDTYVWSSQGLTSSGIAAVSLNNEHLQIHSFINNNWREIGQPLKITKASGNVVYSIDNKKPMQVFRHYLGDQFIKDLPRSGVEFPFLLQKGGEKRTLFVNKIHKNGAIELSGNVEHGELLIFLYINFPDMVDSSLQNMKKMAKKPVESIFMYNCTVRKSSLFHFAAEEAKMLAEIAPVNGFYSYGQFCSQADNSLQLYGCSAVMIGISESKEVHTPEGIRFFYEMPQDMKSILTLTNLIEASSKDIQELNEYVTTSKQYYKSLFDNNNDIVYSTDLQGRFSSVNQACIETLGYPEEEILGTSALKFLKDEDVARVRMYFYRALKGKVQSYDVDITTRTKDRLSFQIKNIPINVNGETVGIYCIGKNITDQKEIEEKMVQLAYYDSNTGLPNRVKFTEQLKELINRATKKKRKLAVMFIDMDRFKIINDSLGHYPGDQVLKEMAERIRKACPAGTYLGRFAGDKFTLILTKNVEAEEVIKIANAIMVTITRPIIYNRQEFFITASIGICMHPEDGIDAHELLKNADTAMNRSKNQGGNRITLYSNEMNEQAIKRLEMESLLRKAVRNKEFFLCYQPLIDLETGKIYGSEALIRWNHPHLGLVSPANFIPIAEETGLIDEIGTWVLYTACRQNKQWQEMGLGELTISVNVSAYQFQQQRFLEHVKQALRESGLHPSHLHLELTESLMLRNITYSVSVMEELQRLGIKVSIDDFGTGYSSLSYLKSLPIDTLKIDRSFISNLRDTTDIAIVKAIITMGQGLDVKIVAEGVETKEQIELLRELKCHYAQGFYIHHPLTASEFESGLAQKRPVPIL